MGVNGYEFRGGIKIDHSKCSGCKQCYEVCPTDCFAFDDDEKLLTMAYPEDCWFCAACIYVCPTEGALEMELPLACL